MFAAQLRYKPKFLVPSSARLFSKLTACRTLLEVVEPLPSPHVALRGTGERLGVMACAQTEAIGRIAASAINFSMSASNLQYRTIDRGLN
jgi:hypothetical protein